MTAVASTSLPGMIRLSRPEISALAAGSGFANHFAFVEPLPTSDARYADAISALIARDLAGWTGEAVALHPILQLVGLALTKPSRVVSVRIDPAAGEPQVAAVGVVDDGAGVVFAVGPGRTVECLPVSPGAAWGRLVVDLIESVGGTDYMAGVTSHRGEDTAAAMVRRTGGQYELTQGGAARSVGRAQVEEAFDA